MYIYNNPFPLLLTPDRMPEHMSDRMPEYMPHRMSEYNMSDQLSEYIEFMSKYTS